MSQQPFIIRNKVLEPIVPIDSELYDERQETRIQILQAINGYLAVTCPSPRSTWLLRV